MTGYGASAASVGGARVGAEVRSVNSRTLDVRSRLPDALAASALWAEQEVRKKLRRGRVELTFSCEGAAQGAALDRARALAAMRELESLSAELGLEGRPPLSLLAAVPGLFGAGPLEGTREAAALALRGALDALDADRAREGAVIAGELSRRCDALLELVARAGARAAALPAGARARLGERLSRLPVSVDPARLEAEVALLAERCDVSEELSRLATHVAHMKALIGESQRAAAGAEPEGRRLDFLLQEALREATTLGVKAQDAEISADVVELKVELERMREQVQNVE